MEDTWKLTLDISVTNPAKKLKMQETLIAIVIAKCNLLFDGHCTNIFTAIKNLTLPFIAGYGFHVSTHIQKFVLGSWNLLWIST